MQGTVMTTREIETGAGKLYGEAGEEMNAGNRDRALLLFDAADALYELYDFDNALKITGASEAGAP